MGFEKKIPKYASAKWSIMEQPKTCWKPSETSRVPTSFRQKDQISSISSPILSLLSLNSNVGLEIHLIWSLAGHTPQWVPGGFPAGFQVLLH